MADKKISQLTASTTPLAGTEVLPIVQGGATKKVSVNDLTAGKSVPGSLFVASSRTTWGTAVAYDAVGPAGNDVGFAFGGGSSIIPVNGNAVATNGVASLGLPSYKWGTIYTADNLVIGTSGKGIDFSADGQAAGMTSELLDDYEEGTWTPVPTRDGGALSATYTSSGTYTKIGRQVFITGIINISAIASQTGSYIVISGLPFNIALNNYQIGGMVTKNNAVTTSVMTKVLAVGSSLYAGTDKNSSFPPDNDTWKTGDFTFSMTYYVA